MDISNADKEQIRKMRREGIEFSQVVDWITREIFYDKEVIEMARDIFYEEYKQKKNKRR